MFGSSPGELVRLVKNFATVGTLRASECRMPALCKFEYSYIITKNFTRQKLMRCYQTHRLTGGGDLLASH
jgi:hypothetical protein